MEREADTVVKMPLDTLCKSGNDFMVDGKPLIDILRKDAIGIHKLASEVSHLLNLHFLERCEKVNRDQPPQKISGQPYDCDPCVEEKWTYKQLLEYFYAITGHAKAAVELLAARKRLYDQLRKDNLPPPPPPTPTTATATTTPTPATTNEWWLLSRSGLHVNSLIFAAKQIATAINTNIQQHFYKRQLRYIKLHDNLHTWDDAKRRQEEINLSAHCTLAQLARSTSK
jgi:hypothetical protein